MNRARETGAQAAEQAREKAGELTGDAREKAGEVRERAGEVTGEARHRMSAMAEERKSQAAEAVERVARAVRSASRSLEEEESERMTRYGERAADQLERLSDYLRENDLRSMTSGAEDFARRRPEIFFGGLLLGGLIAGRFLRSSDTSSRQVSYGRGSSDPGSRANRPALPRQGGQAGDGLMGAEPVYTPERGYASETGRTP